MPQHILRSWHYGEDLDLHLKSPWGWQKWVVFSPNSTLDGLNKQIALTLHTLYCFDTSFCISGTISTTGTTLFSTDQQDVRRWQAHRRSLWYAKASWNAHKDVFSTKNALYGSQLLWRESSVAESVEPSLYGIFCWLCTTLSVLQCVTCVSGK